MRKAIVKGMVWLGWQYVKVWAFAKTMTVGCKSYKAYKECLPFLYNEYMNGVRKGYQEGIKRLKQP